MRLDLQFRPFSSPVRVWLLAALVFGSGMSLSASGQTPPAQTPRVATDTAPAPRTAVQVQLPPSPVADGTPLTIDEAVRMSLENNLGIQQEKLNPQIQALGVSHALAAYSPSLFSTFSRNSSAAPPSDFLSSGVAVVTNSNLQSVAGVQQQMRFGGNYQLSWDGSRAISDAPRTSFSPRLGSDLGVIYNQPLLRNFRIDALRQQVLQSRVQQQSADIGLTQQIAQTSRSVRSAYYNLLGAVAGLDVAEQSLGLARQSLENNQARVKVGTIPPIDLVAAQAEVASNEEAVILSEASIESAEDQLRILLMNPSQPGFWTAKFNPTEQPTLAPRDIDVDAAVRNALANRTDILQLKKQIESTDINLKFAANQRLPGVDLQARYGVTGIGGTQFLYGTSAVDGAPPQVIGQSVRSFGDVLRDVFGNSFRTWTFTVNLSYPIGTSQADATLTQSRLQREQLNTTLRNLEMQVTTSVRNAGRNVNTNLKRVEVTRRARELAEQRLQAEEKRMNVGLSTTFELFQAQRDLSAARQRELQSTIDYNRSLVDFEAVQIVPIQ